MNSPLRLAATASFVRRLWTAPFILAACLPLAPSVLADDPKPAPAPTTAPAPAPPVTPKAIALAFAAALEKGDAAGAKALLPDDPQRVQWLEANLALTGALKKLDAASVARFGEPGKSVSQNRLHLGESLKALEQAQEKIEGDAATLTIPGQPHPLLLKKTGGKWQLMLGPPANHVSNQLALYERLTQAASRTAEEVAAGDYATAPSAAKVFASRVLRARAG